MIKFKAEGMVGFGLSAGNIEKLMQGMPIKVNGKDIGIDHDVVIFYGRTEQDMVQMFKDEGFITDKTITHGVPE